MKPFYIEIDEEVTSVIDRLRGSQQVENIFVVPAAAILLQSVVNVRLLLQEAQRQEKAISIVTADEHAQKLVQKVGIPVYSSLDEVTGVELDLSEPPVATSAPQIGTTQYFDASAAGAQPAQIVQSIEPTPTVAPVAVVPEQLAEPAVVQVDNSAQIAQTQPQAQSQPQVQHQLQHSTQSQISQQPQLSKVGQDAPVYEPAMDVVPGNASNTTLREDLNAIMKETGISGNAIGANSNAQNSAQNSLSAPVSMDMRPPAAVAPNSQINSSQNSVQSAQIAQQPTQAQQPVQPMQFAQSAQIAQNNTTQSTQYQSQLPPHKEKEVRDFFGVKSGKSGAHSSQSITPYAHADEEMASHRAPMRWALWLFGVVVLGVVLGVSFFAFLPKVEVMVTPVSQNQEQTIDIVADGAQAEVDTGAKKIPLIAIDETAEETVVVDTTGTSSAGSFKARGTITISNNFSAKPQPLVATTRFITSDGILFRLVKRVIVPGTKKVDGKVIAGTVEADVIADKPGDKFNIEPSEFTIPGFKGSAKYAKFSAKSDKAMIGGSSEGGTKKVVTEEDLENAKKKAQEAVRTKIIEKLRTTASAQGRTILDDAVEIKIESSGSPVTAGVAATSFDYTVRATAKGLAFGNNDVRTIIAEAMKYDTADGLERIDVKYSPSLADFEKQTLLIKATGILSFTKEVDTKAVIASLAGKSGEEVNIAFAQFDNIQSVETSYQPGFLTGRFPWYKGSISVEIVE